MNAQESENKPKIVFKSIRFDALLAEDLSDYVHEKKKGTKTSIDAEVQRAVRELLAKEGALNKSLKPAVKKKRALAS